MIINTMSKEKLLSDYEKVLLKLIDGKEVPNAVLEKLLRSAMDYVK